MDFEICDYKKTGKITIENEKDIINTNIVIDGSIAPVINNSSEWIRNIEYEEPTEYEKKLLEGTITANKLLEIEKEENEKKIKEKSDEEKLIEDRKNYITKVKVLALYKCKKYPLSNPSDFSNVDKQMVIDKMAKIIKNYTEDELNEEFNKIVSNILLDPNTKYENLPIMRT